MASSGTDGSGIVPPSEEELEKGSVDKIIIRAQGTSRSLRVTLVNGSLWATSLSKGAFQLVDTANYWKEEDLEEALKYVMAVATEQFGADCELTVEDKTKVSEGGSACERRVFPPSEDEINSGEDKIIVNAKAESTTLRVRKINGFLWALFKGHACYLLDKKEYWTEENLEEAKKYVMAAAVEQFGANCELTVEDKTKVSEGRSAGEGLVGSPSEDEIDDGEDKIILRPQVPFTTLRVRKVKGLLWALFQSPESTSLLDTTKHWREEDLEEAKNYVLAAAAEKFGAEHEFDVQVMDES